MLGYFLSRQGIWQKSLRARHLDDKFSNHLPTNLWFNFINHIGAEKVCEKLIIWKIDDSGSQNDIGIDKYFIGHRHHTSLHADQSN